MKFERNIKALKELFEYGSYPYSNRVGAFLEEFEIDGYNFKDLEDYPIRLQMSKSLQQDSNIVIIDPDITTLEDLDDRFDSFNKLIHKFKIFSNDYSYQLWGCDISTMYYKILADIKTNAEPMDTNNIIVKESAKNRDSLYFESSVASNNHLQILKSKLFLEIDDSITNKNYIQEELDIETPNICPWFTVDEMNKMGIEYKRPDHYYKAVNEVIGNKEKLLELGWNPELPVNEKTIKMAKDRQVKWFKENKPLIYDFSNEDISDIKKENEVYNGFLPVYIVTGILTDNKIDNIFSSMYISFDKELKTIFKPRVENGILSGFDKELRTALHSGVGFSITAIFLNREDFSKLANIINNTKLDTPINVSNVLGSIYNNYNELDCTIESIRLKIYLLFITKLIDSNQCNHPGCYKLFNGTIDGFDPAKINNILNLYTDKKAAAKYSASTFHNYVDSVDKEKLANAIRVFMNDVFVPKPLSNTPVAKSEDKLKLI